MVLQREDDKNYFDKKLLDCIMSQKNKKARSILKGCQPAELRDSSGSTLLHYSAKHGNAVMTDYFIEKGCPIDAKNNDEFTPLMLAVKNRHLQTADILLEAGADVCTSQRSAGILLKRVIEWISVERDLKDDFNKELSPIWQDILQPILQRIKENSTTSNDRSIARLLFESDCSLHYVIRTLKNSEVTRYYLENGCPVDAQESTIGRTLLHEAVNAGDLDSVKVLLEHGADINLQTYKGKTVLFYYEDKRDLDEKKLEILRILMKSGAMLSLPDIHGDTPAEKLLSDGQKEVVNIVLPYVDSTIQYGAQNNTVLHALVLNGEITDTKVFELMSEQYFDVNACNSDGATALQLAIYWQRPAEIIDFILRKGGDFSAFYTDMTTFKDVIARSWKIPDTDRPCVKIIELFLLYGGDLRKELPTIKTIHKHWNFDESDLAKLLVAHLVLLEEFGHRFRKLFVPSVATRPVLAKLFKTYKLQIEEMKSSKVYRSITMLDLVAANERKLTRYVINDDLISNFEVLSQNNSRSEWYYYKYAKKRIARAFDLVNYQREASFIIFELTGIKHQLILDKIVEYLHISDFTSLRFVL